MSKRALVLKPLTVIIRPNDTDKHADADIASMGKEPIIRDNPSELYFSQLRLRAEQDRALRGKIGVYYIDAQGDVHEIGLGLEDEFNWPSGFMQEGWRKEVEIGKLRRAQNQKGEGQ